MTKLEEVRAKVIEAVPEAGTRNTSVLIPEPFGGIINHRDTAITLADVLRAMGKILFPAEFDLYGNGLGMSYLTPSEYYTRAKWNLALPLDQQSSEVIEFLHKILCV